MKIVDGVELHLIKNEKFKMNHITFRFSGDFNQKTVARRVLVAQILATANAKYPTAQRFRERLASLYGATLSTKVSTKGLVHIVDIELSFMKNRYTMAKENLLEEVIDFLYQVLFSPLVTVEQYQSKLFELEQTNLINYLKADKDDSFYSSELGLKKLFFENPAFQSSKYGTAELAAAENSYTAFQEFQKMLREDQLDIFILGEFDDYRMLQLFNKFPFEDRHKDLVFDYQQEFGNIVQEKLESREVNQSVLQLGYSFPTRYGDKDYFALLVFNGLFGGFAHSRLFTEVREKEGLAYTIGSHFDIFTGLLNVYAGIDQKNRNKAMQLINKQFSIIKTGRFSEALLKQTKKMLTVNLRLSGDSPKVLIERFYNGQYLENHYNIDEMIDKIDKVSKADILQLTRKIRLQALYFLEGK
ncbi:EF-P 5-aminopentanol modification-associated protein YfmF [Streptococcus equinus]|uniref:EF-P 5-aminopentanol modification-associated protein YfmF n=1 Tax=Streptococcus equinus TaxID=1335 RepID=UPI00237A26F3|nr:pitrilysin family protein [Streptococcus equinus]